MLLAGRKVILIMWSHLQAQLTPWRCRGLVVEPWIAVMTCLSLCLSASELCHVKLLCWRSSPHCDGLHSVNSPLHCCIHNALYRHITAAHSLTGTLPSAQHENIHNLVDHSRDHLAATKQAEFTKHCPLCYGSHDNDIGFNQFANTDRVVSILACRQTEYR